MYIICQDQDEDDHLLIEDTTPVTCQKDFDQYLAALEGIFVKKERMAKEKEYAKELGLDELFSFKKPVAKVAVSETVSEQEEEVKKDDPK